MLFYCGQDKIEKLSVIPILLVALAFVTRIPIELSYRKYFPKIHCIVDMIRVNSIYDNTIGKYGVDDIVKIKDLCHKQILWHD